MSIQTAQERFLSKPIKIERAEKWECWLWCGALDRKGYASFRSGSDRQMAHRFSYELFIGEIPEGLVIDHLCRRRNCINPDHLEPVTNTENTRRGINKIGIYMAGRTHCEQGHALTAENVYLSSQGWQRCKACRRAHRQAYRNRQKSTIQETAVG